MLIDMLPMAEHRLCSFPSSVLTAARACYATLAIWYALSIRGFPSTVFEKRVSL